MQALGDVALAHHSVGRARDQRVAYADSKTARHPRLEIAVGDPIEQGGELFVGDQNRTIEIGAGEDDHIFGLPVSDRATEEGRSEEHTSELQSLMRIPYAVFCLKKNTKTINNIQTK